MLSALLGENYEVRNFGHLGESTCHDLPEPCLGAPEAEPTPKRPHDTGTPGLYKPGTNAWAWNMTRFPLNASVASAESLDACSEALRGSSRI